MSTTVTSWTIAVWNDREAAEYRPIDRHIDNVVIDAYGRRSGTCGYLSGIPRRPVRMESNEMGPSYVMYDSDEAGPVPIIRISEELEAYTPDQDEPAADEPGDSEEE